MIFQATTTIPIEDQLNLLGANLELSDIISSALTVIISFAGVAMLAYLIWGGYKWLTSGGDKAAVETARGHITSALIGLAIVASAFAIYTLIDRFFGIGIVGGPSDPTPSDIFPPTDPRHYQPSPPWQ